MYEMISPCGAAVVVDFVRMQEMACANVSIGGHSRAVKQACAFGLSSLAAASPSHCHGMCFWLQWHTDGSIINSALTNAHAQTGTGFLQERPSVQDAQQYSTEGLCLMS